MTEKEAHAIKDRLNERDDTYATVRIPQEPGGTEFTVSCFETYPSGGIKINSRTILQRLDDEEKWIGYLTFGELL